MEIAMSAGVVLVLVGCSGSSALKETADSGTRKVDGGHAGSMSLNDFCDAFLAAKASVTSRCLGGSASAYEAVANEEYGAGGFAAAVQAAVTAGRLVYNPSAASSCLSGLPSLDCSELTSPTSVPSGCTAALSGTAAMGASCYDGADCAGAVGAVYCDFGTLPTCGGTCGACGAPGSGPTPSGCEPSGPTGTAAKGASCSPAIQCAPVLRCNPTTAVCETPVSLGGSCMQRENLCVTFTYCDATTKSCTALPSVGGTCGLPAGQTDNIGCAGIDWCNLSGSDSGVCATTGDKDVPCTQNEACLSGRCMSGAGTSGTCAAPCTAL